MRIHNLKLYHFRNYSEADIPFCDGINLIHGENAQGKTNLLEAVTYLSVGKSFQTRKEKEMIQFGETAAELNANIFSEGRDRTVRTILYAERKKRELYIGGVKQRTASGLSGVLTTVLFRPEDLGILKGGSAERRREISHVLNQLRPNYEKALSEYQRLLDEKSRILKDYHEYPSLLEMLPDFNARMAQTGALLIHYRAGFIKVLSEYANRFHEEFSSGKESLHIHYRTVSTVTNPFDSISCLTEQLLEHMESHRTAELSTGQCLSGPHKDDMEAEISGLRVKEYASQGQTRTAVISIKLAERQIIKEDTGEEPVLLLDDVLSELDTGRKNFVLNCIRTGQVLITSCEENCIPDIGNIITVKGGKIGKG